MNTILQDIGNSITGNIPKAVLCVKQVSDGDVDLASKGTKLAQSKLQSQTKNALSGSVSFSSLTSKTGILSNTGYIAMEVQFNPSSIYMQTVGGKQVEYQGGKMGNKGNSMIAQNIQPVSTTMDVQLIFDDVNVYDAFMLSNMNLTAGNVLNLGKNILSKKNSVKTQVEGLLALLTNDATRQVLFSWSKMTFRGELTGVQAQYTMFNKVGSPIRATVNLSIRQGDEDGIYDKLNWEYALKNMFKKNKGGGSSTLSKVTNNNFLNLNI